jgi:hypothetical protein
MRRRSLAAAAASLLLVVLLLLAGEADAAETNTTSSAPAIPAGLSPLDGARTADPNVGGWRPGRATHVSEGGRERAMRCERKEKERERVEGGGGGSCASGASPRSR